MVSRQRNRGPATRTQSQVEPLEGRQLLSVAVATDPVPATPARELGLHLALTGGRRVGISTNGGTLVGRYAGTFSASGRNTALTRAVVMNLPNQLAGHVDGTIFIDGVGLYDVTGHIVGRRIDLLFDAGTGGSFRGTLALDTQTISGRFLGPVGSTVLKGTMSMTREGPALVVIPRGGSGAGSIDNRPPSTNGNPVPPLGNPVPGMGNPVPGLGR